MFERFRKNREPVSTEPYDDYFAMFGVRMTHEDLRHIREFEDDLIDGGHISKADRYPTPHYLIDDPAAPTETSYETPGEAGV